MRNNFPFFKLGTAKSKIDMQSRTENKWLNCGVTIVELLIYAALLGIFLTMLVNVFVTSLKFKLESESSSALNQDGRYILAKLSYDIYNADSVSQPLNYGDTSSSLVLVHDGVTNTYAVSGGNLFLTTGGTSAKMNGNDVSIQSISFKRIGDISGQPTIQILLTLQSNIQLAGVTVQTLSLETTAGLR